MTITVYWAPALNVSEHDWGIAYEEPEQLLPRLYKKRNQDNEGGGFLKCPAVTDLTAHIWVLKSGLSTGVKMNDAEETLQSYGVTWRKEHAPTLVDQRHVTMEMGWHFFADKPGTKMLVTAPYYDRTNHLQYGAIMAGSFDIGQWHRPLMGEFLLWKECTEMHLQEGEPFAYVHILTDEKVVFRRFHVNEAIHRMAKTNSNAGTWQPRQTLRSRYDRFMRTRSRDVLLKEIKENLL